MDMNAYREQIPAGIHEYRTAGGRLSKRRSHS